MKNPSYSLLFAIVFAIPASGMAADTGHGKSLQQENCMACHDDGVYTRNDRRVTTMDGLQKQVKRCELTLGLQWFDDDINDVAGYLNESFYKF
jgi:cytochrome c553